MPTTSKPAATPSSNPKDYTGRVVVYHPVRAGETLESISRIYRMPGWEPLWTYNSKIEHIIGSDPDRVRQGVTILIPRSEDGYNRLIRKLEATKDEVDSIVDQTEYQLEALTNEREAESELWNLGGDVATLLGSLVVRLAAAARAASIARKTVGQAKIAARLAAHSESEKFARRYAAARNRLTTKALEQNKAVLETKEALKSFVPGKTKDVAAKLADDRDTKNSLAAAELLRKAWRRTTSAAHFTLDALEIALDYAEVPHIAEWAVSCWSHEKFDEITKRVKDNARATADRLCEHIDNRIEALGRERDLLYP